MTADDGEVRNSDRLIAESDLRSIERNIFEPTLKGMREEGSPFVGVLYAGLMITEAGPKVVEFNVRFGDPEAQVLMNVLRSDLYSIMRRCVDGELKSADVRFCENLFSAGVVVASAGYPWKSDRGTR